MGRVRVRSSRVRVYQFLPVKDTISHDDRARLYRMIFSERELMFMFAICRRPSVCRLSSVTFVHPTQAIEIFSNVSMPFGTLAICDPSVKILRRSSQG